MTVKEEAHQLLDHLPDHVTWEDLLASIRRAARKHFEPSPGGPPSADANGQRSALVQAPVSRERELEEFLEREIWARIPASVLGKPLTKEAREEILGYGSSGI